MINQQRTEMAREIAVGVVLVLSALAVLMVYQRVPALGHRIPQDDLFRDYTVGFFWATLLWMSLLLWPVRPREKKALLVVWGVKIAVTMGAMLFYESHYGLDAYRFFAEPQMQTFGWQGLSYGAGTRNVIQLSWLHQQVIPDSYHALKVSSAFLGLSSIYLFYRAAVRFLGREDERIFYALALFPSILFWSSILGKDTIVLFGIALHVYGVVGFYSRKRRGSSAPWYLFAMLAGVGIASFIRLWLGPILLMPLAVFVLTGVRNHSARIVLLVAIAAAGLFSLTHVQQAFRIETQADLVETTDRLSKSWARGGASQEVAEFRSLGSMVTFAPIGAFTALFRPLPGEIMNPFGIIAGLENALLLVLLVLAIKRTSWTELKNPLLVWAISLILIWAAIYGFVSYQNLGTAVRFRLQVLPIMVALLLYLGRVRPPIHQRGQPG